MTEKNNPDFKVRRLGENEKIESFDCGDVDLNDFHPLTEGDKDDLHTRQLYYDLKTNFSHE